MIHFGLKPSDISLITTFNKDRANLFEKLHNNDVEVLTIDKSQGMDRECIVVLCGAGRGVAGDELLNSMRRVNVAFTRAKKKLIIIGSMKKLKEIPVMGKFIEVIERKKWVFRFEKSMMRSQSQGVGF